MIYAENGNFLLETAHTTYAFCVDTQGICSIFIMAKN